MEFKWRKFDIDGVLWWVREDLLPELFELGIKLSKEEEKVKISKKELLRLYISEPIAYLLKIIKEGKNE